jgi:hypothetical protein
MATTSQIRTCRPRRSRVDDIIRLIDDALAEVAGEGDRRFPTDPPARHGGTRR